MKTRPSLSRLARVLLALLKRVGAEVTSRLRHAHISLFRCPTLFHWVGPLAEAAARYLRLYFVRGGNRAAMRIAGVMTGGRRKADFAWVCKGVGGLRNLARQIFNAAHSFVAEAVRRLSLDFAYSTLATLAKDVNDAASGLREELQEGLEEGEGLRQLAGRVRRIFTDPAKAETIARTEVQRSVYAGEVLAARQSGVVVGHRWLSAPGCCPLCCGIDGKVVRLGEPFLTGVGGNLSYSTVFHPPAHPRCRCALEAAIDPKYLS